MSSIFFFIFKKIIIYLFGCTGSLIVAIKILGVACKLLAVACGNWFPDQGWNPCIGNAGSQPLTTKGVPVSCVS